jgi:hypothetical protein
MIDLYEKALNLKRKKKQEYKQFNTTDNNFSYLHDKKNKNPSPLILSKFSLNMLIWISRFKYNMNFPFYTFSNFTFDIKF